MNWWCFIHAVVGLSFLSATCFNIHETHFDLQQISCTQSLFTILSETSHVFSSTFVTSCFVILFLCLSLLEARVWTTACRHRELKDLEICSLLVQYLQSPEWLATKLNALKVCPGNLSHAEISGCSFSPESVRICMAALFQGSHKDRATYLQKIPDILQSPNGALWCPCDDSILPRLFWLLEWLLGNSR